MSQRPIFHELLSISFASAVLYPPASTAYIYSDNKQALKLAQQASFTLASAFSHLPCGPILQSSPNRLTLHWIRSHPENQTTEPHWTTSQRGIHRVDILAKLSDKARCFLFPNDHLYQIDLIALLNHIIPTGRGLQALNLTTQPIWVGKY